MRMPVAPIGWPSEIPLPRGFTRGSSASRPQSARHASTSLSDGGTGEVWAERLTSDGAEVLASNVDGPSAGGPRSRERPRVPAVAWCVSTRLDGASLDGLLGRVLGAARVSSLVPAPGGLEVVRRSGPSASWLFALNHADTDLPLHAVGRDLVAGRSHADGDVVPARGVVVLREVATP